VSIAAASITAARGRCAARGNSLCDILRAKREPSNSSVWSIRKPTRAAAAAREARRLKSGAAGLATGRPARARDPSRRHRREDRNFFSSRWNVLNQLIQHVWHGTEPAAARA